MPTFAYRGRDNQGALKTGKRTAPSSDALSTQLIKEGIIPVSITTADQASDFLDKLRDFFESKGISTEELSMFSRQMYTLSKAGVPITSALKQFSLNARNPRFAKTMTSIVDHLEAGQDLASALQRYPDIFSPLMISMVRVGQNSGHLDEAFLRLHQYLELESGAIKRVKSSLRYPIIVFFAIIIAIFCVNIFVVPTFAGVFASANISLPLASRILINTSNFFVTYWWLVLTAIVILVASIIRFVRRPRGMLLWDKWKLKMPIVGSIIRRVIMLRFSQSFAITTTSGIPMTEGLNLVANAINNAYARKEILEMQEAIARGSSLTKAAANTDLFTPMELQIFAVSEESGDLSGMLTQLGTYYSSEVEYDLKRMNDLIEPFLIITLSFVILILAFAVYLPIWNMVKIVHT